MKKATPGGEKVSYWKEIASIRETVFFPTGNISLLSVKFLSESEGEKNRGLPVGKLRVWSLTNPGLSEENEYIVPPFLLLNNTNR